MLWIRPRTKDDRGNASRVANHADLKTAGISLSQLALPLPGGKEYTTRKQMTKHHWSSLIAFLGPIPSCLGVLILAQSLRITAVPIILTLVLGSIAFCWWFSINLWLWIYRARFVRAICPTGRCVRCLYDMSRCPIEDDDCRICPECGSAWKVSLAEPRLSL